MKKMRRNQMLWLLVVITSILTPLDAQTGKTFFMPRSFNSMTFMHEAATHRMVHDTAKAPHFNLTATTFYQESVNSKDLARYFLPNGKTELQIAGATSTVANPDISATWLQIAGRNTNAAALPGAAVGPGQAFATEADAELYLNEYASKVRIRPEYKSFGTVLTAQRYFPALSSRLWASVQLPIVHVETNANLQEYDRHNGYESRGEVTPFVEDAGAPVGVTRNEEATLRHALNAYEAFNNPAWRYGKIKGHIANAGFSDLDVKVGYQLNNQVNVYGKVVVPFSRKPRTEYLFEPVIGNGGHLGLGAGLSFDANMQQLFDVSTKSILLHSSAEYQYLFANNQLRSFDLTSYGPWSRYFLVFDRIKSSRLLEPGINYFTRKVEVTPRHEVSWNNSVSVNFSKGFALEFGYNLWYKHKEKVTVSNWDEHVHIAMNNFNGGDPFLLESAQRTVRISNHISATIATPALSAPADVNNEIKVTELNLDSAAHSSACSHTIFANAIINGTWGSMPFVTSVGGNYEIAQSNRALNRWGLFYKISFVI